MAQLHETTTSGESMDGESMDSGSTSAMKGMKEVSSITIPAAFVLVFAACARFDTAPLDFDGVHDALLHEFTGDGRRHMEYLIERGVFTDLPFDHILADLARHYPGDPGADDVEPVDGGDPVFQAPAS